MQEFCINNIFSINIFEKIKWITDKGVFFPRFRKLLACVSQINLLE